MIVVIDGPSGSGKSSTAKAVAEKLGIGYLDSGALYRVASWIWLEERKPSEQAFLDILSSKEIRFSSRDGIFAVEVDGRDLTAEIRKPYVSEHVSHVSAIPTIRSFVNGLMRQAVQERDFIADGRDLGTAVFPTAELKIYMDAPLEVRAERRYDELRCAGEPVTRGEVLKNLESRDLADSTRSNDPLAKAGDAVVIDNSGKTFDEQVEEIASLVRRVLDDNLKRKQ